MSDVEQQQVPSFDQDIRRLFREKDRNSMLYRFDLWSLDDVRLNAEAIYGAVASGSMPCDEQWPNSEIDLLRRWIDGGTRP